VLQQMLDTSRRKLTVLQKQRDRVQKKLDKIDRKIASIAGGRVAAAGGRGGRGPAQNAKSLVATMEGVLKDAGKPLPVGDILDRVRAAGYRSNSANFRALINQTLIKEKRFTPTGRGVYQLKK
jgi:hypothetical protein